MAVTIRNLPLGREFAKKTDYIAVAQTPGSPLTSKISLSAAVNAVMAADSARYMTAAVANSNFVLLPFDAPTTSNVPVGKVGIGIDASSKITMLNRHSTTIDLMATFIGA